MRLNDILEIIKSSGHFNMRVPDERKGDVWMGNFPEEYEIT